ncbi:MAG: hypothetical protein NT076_04565, partial [Candidatus Pacearchaeota archaeon]|nr:hypothetical protein [Candidatus Pacearchaeota archaeon]
IEEALLVRNTLLLLEKYNYGKNMKKREIKSFLDHAVYASYNPSIIEWIGELKERTIKPIDNKITLQYLKKELSRKNLSCYFVNLTKKVFQKIGFYQSKTILPALCQRDMNNNYKFLDNERFKNVPKKLGHTIRMNTNPHPFG